MKFNRNQIIEMVKDGFLNKKSIFHWDVCKALADRKTWARITSEHDITELKTVYNIKKHKCKYCDTD